MALDLTSGMHVKASVVHQQHLKVSSSNHQVSADLLAEYISNKSTQQHVEEC